MPCPALFSARRIFPLASALRIAHSECMETARATTGETEMTYYISMTREFYGNGASTVVDLMGANTFQGVAVFATRAEAEAEIERFDGTVYRQMYNESGRPALRVKTPSQLTVRQAAQAHGRSYEGAA